VQAAPVPVKGPRDAVDTCCVPRPATEGTPKPDIGLEGEPVLEFQPAVDLHSGRLLGFEALVRWMHPTRGLIPPAVLVPWAEANDRIVALDAWVLHEACRQATSWPPDVQVAVNCSLVQLRRHQASVATAAALRRTGLHPDRLTIEVTESAVADDQAGPDLLALARHGVHLAVDDVGTSWSTLENLRRFSIEVAKIDRSFIAALEPREGMNRAIVGAIIHVSRSLAMSTVAEGVETAQQVAALRALGADVAQGYFFAPPMSGHEALLLASREPRACFAVDALGGEADAEMAAPRA
jgi:EAL domain-containing protein (putative c-di-GMP-specific phosphodiesterase class I)